MIGTTLDVDTLPAGRTLDALIAERVMHYIVDRAHGTCFDPNYGDHRIVAIPRYSTGNYASATLWLWLKHEGVDVATLSDPLSVCRAALKYVEQAGK